MRQEEVLMGQAYLAKWGRKVFPSWWEVEMELGVKILN